MNPCPARSYSHGEIEQAVHGAAAEGSEQRAWTYAHELPIKADVRKVIANVAGETVTVSPVVRLEI